MRTHQAAIESGDIETVFSDIIGGYRALNALYWFFNEGGMVPDAYETIEAKSGLTCLLEHQVERLEDIAEAVRIKDIMLEEFRSAGRKAEAPETARAKSLRDEFIATKAREGVDAGDIAAAMNMKRASIERVIKQLEGAGHPPGEQQQTAANG